jgi:hypothetical protein
VTSFELQFVSESCIYYKIVGFVTHLGFQYVMLNRSIVSVYVGKSIIWEILMWFGIFESG